jgi:hypothetical protein
MKKVIVILLGMIFATAAHISSAQNSPKRQQDTSKAWKRTYQTKVIPDPAVTGPLQKTDTTRVYINPIYDSGIRRAEYQNRGAEDRRNLNPGEPNAIPNKQVPAKEVLPPKTVK